MTHHMAGKTPTEVLAMVKARVNPAFLQDDRHFAPLPHVVAVLEQIVQQQQQNQQQQEQQQQPQREQQQYPLQEQQPEGTHAQYQRDLRMVEEAVDAVVGSQYAGFGDSVQAFSVISQLYTEAHARVGELQDSITNNAHTLTNRKRNLKELQFRKVQHEHMLRLLLSVKRVVDGPTAIRELLHSGRRVECVELLLELSRLVADPELGKIPALDSAKREIVDIQRSVVGDHLKAELVDDVGGLGSRPSGAPSAEDDEELGDIVKALELLGDLPVALQDVRARLRATLRDIIASEMAYWGSRIDSLGPIYGWRLRRREARSMLATRRVDGSLFRVVMARILFRMRALLARHAALNKWCGEGDTHSLRLTWSAVQVELRELLEVHLGAGVGAGSVGSDAAPHALDVAARRGVERDGLGLRGGAGARIAFGFDFANQDTVEAGGPGRAESYTNVSSVQAEYVALFEPSPYLLRYVVAELERFAQLGQQGELAAGLVDSVREMVTGTFVPRVERDALAALEQVLEKPGASCLAVVTRFRDVAREVRLCVRFGNVCPEVSVLGAVEQRFVAWARARYPHVSEARMRVLVRDPLFLALRTGKAVDRDVLREAHAEFMQGLDTRTRAATGAGKHGFTVEAVAELAAAMLWLEEEGEATARELAGEILVALRWDVVSAAAVEPGADEHVDSILRRYLGRKVVGYVMGVP